MPTALHPIEVSGGSGVQLEIGSGTDAALLTWAALGGRVYRVVGVYPLAEAHVQRPLLAASAASLRPLTADDRERVRAARLRIRAVRAGETLEALLARSRSAWSAEEVAVANDLAPGAPLAPGTRLKVAVAEPWKAPPQEDTTR